MVERLGAEHLRSRALQDSQPRQSFVGILAQPRNASFDLIDLRAVLLYSRLGLLNARDRPR